MNKIYTREECIEEQKKIKSFLVPYENHYLAIVTFSFHQSEETGTIALMVPNDCAIPNDFKVTYDNMLIANKHLPNGVLYYDDMYWTNWFPWEKYIYVR